MYLLANPLKYYFQEEKQHKSIMNKNPANHIQIPQFLQYDDKHEEL